MQRTFSAYLAFSVPRMSEDPSEDIISMSMMVSSSGFETKKGESTRFQACSDDLDQKAFEQGMDNRTGNEGEGGKNEKPPFGADHTSFSRPCHAFRHPDLTTKMLLT